MIDVRFTRLSHARDLPAPEYATLGAAAVDLRAALPADAPITLQPGGRARVPTGLAIEVPEGWEAQVRPRSGLADRHGITCLNTPGTVDSDYRGELQVILINHGGESFTLQRGDRMAQLVIAPAPQVRWREVDALTDSARGSGGFGSTGVG